MNKPRTYKNEKMKQNKTLLETMNILRGIFMFIFLTVTFSVFSQVDLITTGYYTVYQNGRFISQHTLQAKADAKVFNLQAQYPDSLNYYIPPTNVRAVGKIDINSLEIIDTIQVNRRVDTEGNLVGGFLDNVKGNGYFLTYEIEEMICFKTDSIPSWQRKYNFKRTKTFGKISYENLNIPFQFVDVWSNEEVNGVAIWCKITEPYVRITSWVDGVPFKEFFRPLADGNNPFMFGIPRTGEFKMEVENEKGGVIIYETTLKL